MTVSVPVVPRDDEDRSGVDLDVNPVVMGEDLDDATFDHVEQFLIVSESQRACALPCGRSRCRSLPCIVARSLQGGQSRAQSSADQCSNGFETDEWM